MTKPKQQAFKNSWVFDYQQAMEVIRRRELQHKLDAKVDPKRLRALNLHLAGRF